MSQKEQQLVKSFAKTMLPSPLLSFWRRRLASLPGGVGSLLHIGIRTSQFSTTISVCECEMRLTFHALVNKTQ